MNLEVKVPPGANKRHKPRTPQRWLSRATGFLIEYPRESVIGGAILTWGTVKALRSSIRTASNSFTDRRESLTHSVVRDRPEEDMSLDAPELADGMLPTHYTREALPPPAPEMQAFLDQLKKDAEKIRTLQTGVKSADILRNDDRVTPVDKGKPALNPIDPGKPSINFT